MIFFPSWRVKVRPAVGRRRAAMRSWKATSPRQALSCFEPEVCETLGCGLEPRFPRDQGGDGSCRSQRAGRHEAAEDPERCRRRPRARQVFIRRSAPAAFIVAKLAWARSTVSGWLATIGESDDEP